VQTDPVPLTRADLPTVLAATHYPPMPGGSSRSCSLLWQAIARRGHRMVALGPITPADRARGEDPRGELPETMTVARYDVPYFHLSPYSVEEFERYQQIEHEGIRRALPQLVDRFRPDVLVAAHETLGEAVLDCAREKGLPFALMLRGSPTWQIVTDQYPADRAETYLDLYRRADVVIAVGAYMAEGLGRRGVADVIHIPNFLDLAAFTPSSRDPLLAARYGIAPDDVVVLHASVMQSRKRPEDVLRSAAITLPQAPKLLYLFLGGEERGRALEEASRRQGTAERTRFIDRVSYDEMPDHVRLADMVVLASAGEGIARVYLETQACGRVLISSDIPAGREVVEHGRTGLLFELGSVEELAEQILTAYRDVALRERIGTAARQRMAPHEIGRVVDRYVDVLSDLVRGRRAASGSGVARGAAAGSARPWSS
jgi:glycosyltransferase involved in cell wall biosynthesis